MNGNGKIEIPADVIIRGILRDITGVKGWEDRLAALAEAFDLLEEAFDEPTEERIAAVEQRANEAIDAAAQDIVARMFLHHVELTHPLLHHYVRDKDGTTWYINHLTRVSDEQPLLGWLLVGHSYGGEREEVFPADYPFEILDRGALA